MDINDMLIECFMENRLFTIEEQKQIMTATSAPEKLKLLLQKISTSLKADNAKSFYIMLKAMKKHGSKGTQTLADHIMKRLKITADKLSYICNDGGEAQSDKTEGVLFNNGIDDGRAQSDKREGISSNM